MRLLALVLWLALAGSAGAADLGDKAAPGLTWFDLMKLVVPDLTWAKGGKAVGHDTVPFNHIDGKDQRADPADEFAFDSVDVLKIPGDASRAIVLADLGPSEGNISDAQLLALFSLEPKPRLLDVMEVGTDRFVGFHEAPIVMLNARTPLVLVYSEHDNSDQSYVSMAILSVKDDRFFEIGTVFSFGEQLCSYKRVQTPIFTAVPDTGPYKAIQVRVTETTTQNGEGCGDEKPPPAGVRVFEATYHWDPKRANFFTRSKALDRLREEDVKRF